MSSKRRTERGASLVEYALLAALVALACFAAVQFLGAQAPKPLNKMGSSLQSMAVYSPTANAL